MTPKTKLALDGTEQTITEWALDYGLTPAIIIARIERGAGIEAAITTPMRTGHAGQKLPIFHVRQKARDGRAACHEFEGQKQTLQVLSRRFGLSKSALQKRLRKGWSLERALKTPCRRKKTPGVSDDFAQVLGTGAGSTAQETTNIDFHKDIENADCNG